MVLFAVKEAPKMRCSLGFYLGQIRGQNGIPFMPKQVLLCCIISIFSFLLEERAPAESAVKTQHEEILIKMFNITEEFFHPQKFVFMEFDNRNFVLHALSTPLNMLDANYIYSSISLTTTQHIKSKCDEGSPSLLGHFPACVSRNKVSFRHDDFNTTFSFPINKSDLFRSAGMMRPLTKGTSILYVNNEGESIIQVEENRKSLVLSRLLSISKWKHHWFWGTFVDGRMYLNSIIEPYCIDKHGNFLVHGFRETSALFWVDATGKVLLAGDLMAYEWTTYFNVVDDLTSSIVLFCHAGITEGAIIKSYDTNRLKMIGTYENSSVIGFISIGGSGYAFTPHQIIKIDLPLLSKSEILYSKD